MKRNFEYMFFTIFLSLFIHCFPAGADESPAFLQTLSAGTIDWTNGILRAKGTASPAGTHSGDNDSEERLMEEAIRRAGENLLTLIYNVRVDALTLLEEIAGSDEAFGKKLKEMAANAKVVKREYMADGTVEATMEMPVHGGFSQLVLPSEITQLETIKPMVRKKAPPANTDSGGDETAVDNPAGSHTGLVIDATALKAIPAMAPRILNEKGEQVYGAAYVSREFAVQNGVCGYTRSLSAALNSDRVANNPLTVKGLRTNGPALSDIVISNTDASRIRGSSENLIFLKKCRVMVVLD